MTGFWLLVNIKKNLIFKKRLDISERNKAKVHAKSLITKDLGGRAGGDS